MDKVRKRFREIADDMLIPVLEFDSDLKLRYANPKALELFKMEMKDVYNRIHLDTFVAEEQVDLVHRGLVQLEAGEKPTSLSLRVVRKDNVQVPTQIYSDKIEHDGKVIGFVAYIVDLSRREAFEEKIEERKDLLEYIVEYSTFSGIAIIDDKYRLEYVNDKLCDIVGMRRAELIGFDFRSLVHPDSLELVSDRYRRRQLGEDVPPSYEFKIRRGDGSARDVRIHVTTMTGKNGATKSITQAMDITEQKADRRRLEESEHNYRRLVETMTAGMGIDDENGIIVYTNDALNEMLGYEENELIGKHGTTIFHDVAEEKYKMRADARRRGEVEHYETTLVSKSGDLIQAMASAGPIRDPEGNYTGSFAIFTDVSALKAAENESRFLLDLLMHDVGNQMQLILAGGDFLARESTPEEIVRAKQYVLDGAHRCLTLIGKVRKAEETKADPVVATDLVKVLEGEIELLASQYNITPNLTGIPRKVKVFADGALSQLLWNLIENGVRHNTGDDPQIWISGKISHDAFKLIVADNGPGLNVSKKQALFDAGRRYGGVGLHLVRRLADKYGAKLDVHDRVKGQPEKGLEVSIEFRLAE
ncbi:MAG: PAS domain S-box protein, partial [Promethearchaeota archaeon]